MVQYDACPVHPDVPLMRLHVNGNQGIKYMIATATKFHYCYKCDAPYEIIPHKAVVLLQKGIQRRKYGKRGLQIKSSVGINEK